MQTITDLNKKVVYRSVKVVYFLATAGLFIFAVSLFYEKSTIYPSNNNITRITCASSPMDGVNINKARYGILPTAETLTPEQKQAIARDICKDSSSTSFEKINRYPELFLSDNLVFRASNGVMEKQLRYFYFLGLCLLFILGATLITEVLRRVVYYIILGTFMPKY